MKKGMNLRKYKKTMIVKGTIGCIVISILSIGFLAYFVFSNQFDSYKNNQSIVKHVNSIRDLKTINLQKLNDVIILDNDLVFEEDFVLGSQNKIFEGEFYGNGHSITFKNTVATPFIYQIGEKGSVTNVEIKYENVYFDLKKDFGGIALTNHGKIFNCKVNYESNVTIKTSNCVGGLVAYNYGSIEHCLNIATFDDNQIGLLNSIIGGIVGFNDKSGSIKNCVSDIHSFYIDDRYNNIIVGQTPLPKFGGIVGANSADKNMIVNNYCNETLKISSDYIKQLVSYLSNKEIKGKSAYLPDKTNFDTQYWIINENDYPSLRNGGKLNEKQN